jgi:alpha-mannosidase
MKTKKLNVLTVALCFMLCASTTFVLATSPDHKVTKARAFAKDTIHVVGHSHMDMNWLWNYSETMKMCNDNFRQVIAFMEEYPDYTMVQSEAAAYNFVERVDPPLFKKIQKYVKEGRLEPVGGMWVESDQNLPSGEALSRAFLLGQRYFMSKFNKIAKVGWLPDDFGHTAQLPQILKLAGCDYFYFMRCNPYNGSFWWVAPDSSRVLCYTGGSYNGDIKKDELLKDMKTFVPDKHRLFHPTGVGDHGGGPTRENIEMVHQLDKAKDFPAIKFTTASAFFEKLSREMDGRPTQRGEMQYIFEGCYSNVAENKEGNRNCENALYGSEFFNTLRWINGDVYPATELRDIWKTVAFNQFHDILTGSAIYESNRESAARYTEALRKANELRDNAFRKMADEISFQKGKGQPIVAYNLQPYGRKAIVEAEVYSHEMPATAKVEGWGNYYGSKYITTIDKGQGNVASVLVQDGTGKTYPAQIVWGKVFPPGVRSKVQFVVDDMPAGGYKTFYVDLTQPGKMNDAIPYSNHTFETDYFKVKIDEATGDITSLYDKRTKTEYVKQGAHLNTLRMFMEDKKGEMKSWTINRNVKIEDVTNVSGKVRIENGPVRACIESEKTWGKSRFIQRTYIYRSYPRIDYDMEIHWLECGSDTTDSPMLRAVFPLATTDSRFYSQVPFAVLERPANGKFNGGEIPAYLNHHKDNPSTVEMNDGQEIPAQNWVDVNNGKTGIALLNKTKYGHSYHNGELRMTLMRSAGSPDIYPNLGKFNISYSLFPHAGDWTNGVMLEGADFNVPVFAAEPPSLALVKEHATRPEEDSFISLDKNNVAFTGIKQSEDGDELIVRLCEMEGKATTATLKLPAAVKFARRLNLIELPLNDVVTPEVNDRTVVVKLRANEIVTLGIKL